GPIGAGTAIATLARPGALATVAAGTVAVGTGPVAAASTTIAAGAVATIGPVAAVATVATFATPLGREGGGDELVVGHRAGDDLQPVGGLLLRLGRRDGQDVGAVERGLHVGAQD